MTRSHSAVLTSAFVASLIAFPGTGMAQTTMQGGRADPAPVPPDSSGVGTDDIIVTAQKRAQSLNDVGLSVTVASGDQLTNLGVKSTDDLVKITPGLTFAKSVDGTPLYTLRGVGFNDYTLGSSPAVSLYVDEVGLAFGQFARGAVLDLERVEVVKGPQGILFGQNATGGAINYIAKKPTKELEAGGGVSFGRFDTFDGDVYLSGPVSDTLQLRFAGSTTQSGGWQKSVSRGDKLGRQDIVRGRFQAQWQPAEALTFLFSASGWKDHSETQAAQLIGIETQVPFAANPTGPVQIDVNNRITLLRAQPLARRNNRSADWNPDRSFKRDDDFQLYSLRTDYDLNDDVTVTSISAFSRYNEDNPIDRDGTALPVAEARTKSGVKVFNQELRLAGDSSGFNWLVGGNYSNQKVDSSNDYFVGAATNTIVFPDLPIQRTNTTITQRIRSYAGFANLEYEVSPTITLLAGGRYTTTRTRFTACLTGDANNQITFKTLGDLLSGTTTAPASPTDCVNLAGANVLSRGLELNQIIRQPYADTLKEDNVSWRAGVNYKPNRDVLLYGLISRGYKSGAYGAIPASTTSQFIPASQEELTAFEAGAKLSMLAGLLQLNTAVFYYDYKDKQVRGAVIDPVFGLLDQLVNVPKSRIVGVEADATIRPAEGLSLRGSIAYVGSKIKEYSGISNARESADFSGFALPFSPKWNAIADINYETDVGADLRGFAGAHLLYNSSTNATFGNPVELRLRAYTTLDLIAGVRSADRRWEVSVFGRNVTNEYYWNNAYKAQDIVARIAAQPATYGVNLRFNLK